MAKLVVTLHGQTLTELKLLPGHEYFAGRGSSCAIPLSQERGISRQHLKFFQESGIWTVQLISKYGGMIYGGDTVSHIELKHDLNFSVPPYEFYYTDKVETAPVLSPAHTQASQSAPTTQTPTAQSSPDGLDTTNPAVSTLVAYVRINNNTTKTEEVFKLEGHLWTAGRHPSCELVINDSAISRKHFDLEHRDDGYYMTDHGSSNGTKLNGDRIEAHKALKLSSGDIITIRSIEVIFEIHDALYQTQLIMIEEAARHTAEEHEAQVAAGEAVLVPYQGETHLLTQVNIPPAVLRVPRGAERQKKKFKPTFIHLVVGLLSVLFAYLLFSGDNNSGKPRPGTTNAASTSDGGTKAQPMEDLSPEKRKEVMDLFNLTKNYYVQRKYLLCLSQLEKLHALVASYDNSKELESLCKQAQELDQIEEDRRRKEEKRAEVENVIRKTVEECRQQVNATTTSAEIDLCLQPAIELNPQDGQVMELQSLVRMQENASEEKQAKELVQRRRLAAARALFESASRNYHTGQLKLALRQFNDFISGNYGLVQETNEAVRNIASISKTLDEKIEEQMTVCQAAVDKADLKGAIKACDSVLKESPNNEKARANKDKAYSQLKQEMKSIYEDGSLEESMGNIELAKEKWTKILESSTPEDEYYKKAKQKLKKYGVGM